MRKNLPFVFLLALAVSMFAWALYAPKENIAQKISRKLETQRKQADLFMKGVTFSEIVGGVKYWEIKALSSEVNKNKGTALLSETKGTFFSKGMPTFQILSPHIVWNMGAKEIFIDSAIGFGKSIKFETEKLYWGLKTKKLSTDKEISIERDGVSIKAKGFSADLALSNILLKGRPQAEVKFEPQESILHINSDLFEIDGKKNIIIAKGNAVVKREDLTLLCSELKYFEKAAMAEAAGNIKISYKDINASSDSAVYLFKENKIKLLQNARSSRSGNTLSGEKLIIDLKNNKIIIEGKTKAEIKDESIEMDNN